MTSATPNFREVSNALALNIRRLAEQLLGKPSLKSRHEWRYGRKGSLAVVIEGNKKGSFFDHERGEGGDALELVRRVNGGTTLDALIWAQHWLGLNEWLPRSLPPGPGTAWAEEYKKANAAAEANGRCVVTDLKQEYQRIERALAIWDETVPMKGTIAETYLRHRGCFPPDEVADLRFHPSCPAGEGSRLPALIALMRDAQSDDPRGIHRTFLRPDGKGKDPAGKKMLGAAKGAAIKFSPDDRIPSPGLGLAEGIENALTIWASCGVSPVWAAGSAGAIKTFPVINRFKWLFIFSDADDGGVGIEAARACAKRWAEADIPVSIHKPRTGADWNDVLRGSSHE